jgi:hypothetical protein
LGINRLINTADFPKAFVMESLRITVIHNGDGIPASVVLVTEDFRGDYDPIFGLEVDFFNRELAGRHDAKSICRAGVRSPPLRNSGFAEAKDRGRNN